MAALHEVGWHIRGCGCIQKETLRFVVSAETAEPSGIGLEERDTHHRVEDSENEAGHGEIEVVFELRANPTGQERFGKKIRRLLPDEDELVLRTPEDAKADFDLSIRPTDAAEGLRFARGSGKSELLSEAIVLDSTDAATLVDVGEPIGCRPPQPAAAKRTASPPNSCEPYVRIWFVAPPHAISESSVDPSISERLKALGYSW